MTDIFIRIVRNYTAVLAYVVAVHAITQSGQSRSQYTHTKNLRNACTYIRTMTSQHYITKTTNTGNNQFQVQQSQHLPPSNSKSPHSLFTYQNDQGGFEIVSNDAG